MPFLGDRPQIYKSYISDPCKEERLKSKGPRNTGHFPSRAQLPVSLMAASWRSGSELDVAEGGLGIRKGTGAPEILSADSECSYKNNKWMLT